MGWCLLSGCASRLASCRYCLGVLGSLDVACIHSAPMLLIPAALMIPIPAVPTLPISGRLVVAVLRECHVIVCRFGQGCTSSARLLITRCRQQLQCPAPCLAALVLPLVSLPVLPPVPLFHANDCSFAVYRVSRVYLACTPMKVSVFFATPYGVLSGSGLVHG